MRHSVSLAGARRGRSGAPSGSAASSSTTSEATWTMGMLNRSAVVIRPLPPYLDWAKQDDITDIAERVFDDLRTAPHVYLLPEYEDAESEREVLDDFLAGAVRGDVELLADR